MFAFNPRFASQDAPAIPLVGAWGAAYAGQHGPLLGLSQAVPADPPPAEFLQQLAHEAGLPSNCGYGAIEGEETLRKALAAQATQLYDTAIEPGNVHITAGCNQAFFALMLALVQSGDSVVLVEPWYFNQHSTLTGLGVEVEPVQARAERGFTPDPNDIERALQKGARAVVLVSPNNPTGAVYPAALLQDIAERCLTHRAWLIVDETYRDFLPHSGAPHRLLETLPHSGHVISLYSFSKAYGIPGHRLGALMASKAVVSEVAKVMDNLQICAPRAAQQATAWAIPALADWREAGRQEVLARGAVLREVFEQLPEWTLGSTGAYFAYVRHPWRGQSSIAVAEQLARNWGVLGIPGEFFGPHQGDWLRLAFANVNADQIRALGDRLRAAHQSGALAGA